MEHGLLRHTKEKKNQGQRRIASSIGLRMKRLFVIIATKLESATNEALKAIDGYSYHHIKKYKKLI